MSDVREEEVERGDTDETHVVQPENVRAVRLGHGANCSSVGSVIDTLFASAVVGGAIFAAIAAALSNEDVTVVGPQSQREPTPSEPDPPREEEAP